MYVYIYYVSSFYVMYLLGFIGLYICWLRKFASGCILNFFGASIIVFFFFFFSSILPLLQYYYVRLFLYLYLSVMHLFLLSLLYFLYSVFLFFSFSFFFFVLYLTFLYFLEPTFFFLLVFYLSSSKTFSFLSSTNLVIFSTSLLPLQNFPHSLGIFFVSSPTHSCNSFIVVVKEKICISQTVFCLLSLVVKPKPQVQVFILFSEAFIVIIFLASRSCLTL